MNSEVDIIEQIRMFSSFSPLVPLLVYLRRARESPWQNHWVALLIVLSSSVDLLTFLGIITTPTIHAMYSLAEFALISAFFYQLIYKNRMRFLVFISAAIYLVVLSYSIAVYGFGKFYSGLLSMASLIFIIHSLIYTVSSPHMTVERYFDKNFYSNVVFNASIFGYYLILLTITTLHDQVLLLKDENVFRAFWSVHNVFNIIKNLGFAFAFHYTGKRHVYMTFGELERIASKQSEEIRNT